MFIMTIGMLSLLALFPLGVLRMAQSMRDERAGQCVQQARQIASIKDFRHDGVLSAGTYFKDAGGTSPAVSAGSPSYGVYLDPIGEYTAGAGASGTYVGGVLSGTKTIPRVRPQFVVNRPQDFRPWFTLPDELIFAPDLKPVTLPTGQIMKESSFSWAYLLQCPDYGMDRFVNATAVIYYKRPTELGASLQLAEGTCKGVKIKVTQDPPLTGTFNVSNSVFIPSSSSPPPIKIGDWLLDCTVATVNGKITPHAKFYRTVSVSDETHPLFGPGLRVEVHSALSGFAQPTSLAEISADLIVMDGVYDVVDLGVGRLP